MLAKHNVCKTTSQQKELGLLGAYRVGRVKCRGELNGREGFGSSGCFTLSQVSDDSLFL